MNNTVVNILGTEYRIEFKNIEDDPILKNANGYTDPTVKKIVMLRTLTFFREKSSVMRSYTPTLKNLVFQQTLKI